MKNLKRISTLALALTVLFLASCDKDGKINPNLAAGVLGTYNGTLTTIGGNSSPATADVTAYNDYTVEVHCYGADLDTTILLELYEDGNMMNVCFADDDFYEEYGHNRSKDHHSMMGGSWTNWQQHMSNEHDANDQHYGNFDMDKKEFDYKFEVKTSSNTMTQQFVGIKQ